MLIGAHVSPAGGAGKFCPGIPGNKKTRRSGVFFDSFMSFVRLSQRERISARKLPPEVRERKRSH